MNFFKKNGAGLLLCLLIAIPSWLLGKAVPVVGGLFYSDRYDRYPDPDR